MSTVTQDIDVVFFPSMALAGSLFDVDSCVRSFTRLVDAEEFANQKQEEGNEVLVCRYRLQSPYSSGALTKCGT